MSVRLRTMAAALCILCFCAVGTSPASGAAASPSTGDRALAPTSLAPYTLLGAFPGSGNGGYYTLDLSTATPLRLWQGKHHAILSVYGAPTYESYWGPQLDTIWNTERAVPMLTYYPLWRNDEIAQGLHNADLMPTITQLRQFVAGPNAVLGDNDDRRVFFRWETEANSSFQTFQPCTGVAGNTATDYRQAWHTVHDLFVANGLDSHGVAWIFNNQSVNACPLGKPALTYPGSDYVDWLGIDGFAVCPGGTSPAEVFDTMRTNLRSIDSSKPLGLQEVGVSSYFGNTSKNQWISDYWTYVHDHDIRMSVWQNTNPTHSPDCAQFDKPWAVFMKKVTGWTWGDELYGSGTYKGFSAYRLAVDPQWVTGADWNNDRLITNDQFLGQ